jgi:hypothetical protein
MPHAQSEPLASNAYSVEFELPTWMTGEELGMATGSGDKIVSALDPPENDPQCWTVQAWAELAKTGGTVAAQATAITAEHAKSTLVGRTTGIPSTADSTGTSGGVNPEDPSYLPATVLAGGIPTKLLKKK